MKNLLLTAFGLCALFANAQKPDNALLWKISGNGLSKPSYLFGTIHMTCDATLDKNVLTALDNTSQLYLELDMDNPDMQAEMMGGMMMKDGVTMSSLVSAEDFAALNAFLQKEIGMTATMLNTFKPFMVSSLLLPKMIDCTPESYEQKLMEVAKQQNEETYGLETIAEQLAVFDAIPYQAQMDELVKTAKDGMVKDKAEFAKLMEVYKTKDLTKLLATMDESENKMYAAFNDILLVDRNASWIPKIAETAKAKSTFFGVGAAHLAGEQGVIMLLRKKGYTVEAVK
jgi:uncharacterized protein YbaP (TraB family)